MLKFTKFFVGSGEVSGCEESREGVMWGIICLCILVMREMGKCEDGFVKFWVSDEKFIWKKWLEK